MNLIGTVISRKNYDNSLKYCFLMSPHLHIAYMCIYTCKDICTKIVYSDVYIYIHV